MLRALVEAGRALTLTEISSAAGMPTAKAHKYLASFVRCGLATQAEIGARYDLGPFALELGFAAIRRLNVMDVAPAIMENLRDQFDVTVSLAVWANHGPTVVRLADTPFIVSLSIRIGTVLPVLTSAFGRVFATFLDRRFSQDLIQRELSEQSALTVRAGLKNLRDVDRVIAECRTRGLSIVEDLVAPGRVVIAAPVFDHDNKIVAALALVGVQNALDTKLDGEPMNHLRQAAGLLSRRLGHPPGLAA